MDNHEIPTGSLQSPRIKRSYSRLEPEVILILIQKKNSLIEFVFEKRTSVAAAARFLGINNSTAKVTIRNHREVLHRIES